MTPNQDIALIGKPDPPTDEDLFSFAELAQLADRSDQFSRSTMDKLRILVHSMERFAPQLAYLKALAEDAGLPEDQDDRLHAGWLCNQEFDALQATPAWRHPAEVLDPDGNLGIGYAELIHIAGIRARRAEEPAALQAIGEKLRAAKSAEGPSQDCVDAFVTALLAAEPEDAEILLSRAERAYRFQRRRAEEEGGRGSRA